MGFTELIIAAGFFAASAAKPVDMLRVKVMLPCGPLLNVFITFVIWSNDDLAVDMLQLSEIPMYGWACLTYGFFTMVLYSCGIGRTLRVPSQVRWYASVRALSYMVSFALTG